MQINLHKNNREISQNRVTVLGHKHHCSKLQFQSSPFKMKINELKTCSPKISSIRPRMNRDRTDDENCPGEKLHSTEALISDCKYDLPKLQIRSPPFRMKINKSPASPPNLRSIEPQMNRHRPFDQIWAVKIKRKKTVFFSSNFKDGSLSFYLPFLLWRPHRSRRRGRLL